MWPQDPHILNDKPRIDACYTASAKYLASHDAIRERVARHIWGYHEICDLIPQSPSNFTSGHYFPIAESYSQFECAYELTLEGFYRQALSTLRWVLELGLLQVFFALDDREEVAIQPWLSGAERTPSRSELLAGLRQLPFLQAFDQRFGFIDRVRETLDELDAFTHTRGRTHSGFGLTGTNVIAFSESAFTRCLDVLTRVTREVVTALLLKYPMGLQPLPLDEKYGLCGPMGGFLQGYQVQLVRGLLRPEEADSLQRLSDEDESVQATVQYFEGLPDLTPDEWQRQSEAFDRMELENSRGGSPASDHSEPES